MKKTLLIASVVLFLGACTNLDLDNLGDVNYSPSLVLPIGTVTTDVGTLISSIDSVVEIDEETKTLYFEYEIPEQTVSPMDLDKYSHGSEIKLEQRLDKATVINELFDRFPNINEVPLPADDYEFEMNERYFFSFNDIGSDDMEYKIYGCHVSSADFQIDVDIDGIQLSEDNYIDISVTFPTIDLPARETLVFTERITENITTLKQTYNNFYLQFAEDDNGNSVPMNVTLTLHSSGTTNITREAAIRFSTQFHTMGFKDIQGFFYQKEPLMSGDSTISIGSNAVLDNIMDGNTLLFHNPQISLELTHNVGVPFEVDINEFCASDKNGEKRCLTFDGFHSKKIQIPAAIMEEDGTASIVVENLTFDRENGGTNNLFSILPESVKYSWAIYANKKDESAHQFVTSDLFFKFKGKMHVPFVFDAGTRFAYDTIFDADLSELIPASDTLKIEAVKLFCDIANSIPIDLAIKLTFFGENDEILFESKETSVKSAKVDDEGRAIAPSDQKLDIVCKGETIDKVLQAKRIALRATVSGYDAESGICLRTTDSLSVKLSAFATVSATLTLNRN